jgi:hypothetical protein
VAEDARFELARGCPNTLSKSADHGSGTAAGVRDLGRSDIAYARARPRTPVNETETETGPRLRELRPGLGEARTAFLALAAVSG